MLASELIKQIQDNINQYGDLQIKKLEDESEQYVITDIYAIRFHSDTHNKYNEYFFID